MHTAHLNYLTSTSSPKIQTIGVEDLATQPRHRWYYVKEAFSATLVQTAIDSCIENDADLIIDPFSGSGTVSLVSALNGIRCISYEVNPFLAFLSTTKLTQTNPHTLARHFNPLISAIYKGCESLLESFSTFSDNGYHSKWLFNKDILRAFEGGWQYTINAPKPTQRLLQLLLIASAMDCCNAYKDGKCLRYKSNWQENPFTIDDLIRVFTQRFQNVMEDINVAHLYNAKSRIVAGDSRKKLLSNTVQSKFKLCVTSPPYLNSFDYTDIYRPELFLGKFITSMEQLRKLRHETIRSHVQCDWDKPALHDFGAVFSDCLHAIQNNINGLWNKRIPMMLTAYFEDMFKILSALKSIAANNASVWMVVSTSAYCGIEIPVDLIIAEIGSRAGWFLREVNVARYLRRVPVQQWSRLAKAKANRPHLRESIIIFEAQRPAPVSHNYAKQ